MEAELYQKACPEDFYAAFLKESIRPDGRTFQETRPVAIQLGVRGASSSLVRIGNTSVLCQVTIPMTSTSLHILGASGPLQFLLKRIGLKGSVDVQVVQDDGNLLETVLLAYQMAVISTSSNLTEPDFAEMRFAFTYCDLMKALLRDPTKEESSLADAELSIIFSGDGTLVMPMKVGGKPIALSDLEEMMTLAKGELKALRENLGTVVAQRQFVGNLYLPRNVEIRGL